MTTRSKEQRILVVMRKLLAQIVKDTTPGPGMRHPLNEQTIKDIRDCFGLISARERELSEQAGIENKDRPRYVDEPKTSTVLEFKAPNKVKPDKTPSDD
ncbi:MAG: segregation and condensation protein A [Gammaproteobacteria bacterium]|nr:MAG: segregation and condensation protein A [Gammaproteobacteria bacterium]